MINDNFQEAAEKYSEAIYDICRKLSMPLLDEDWHFQRKFDDKIGHLRDKQKYTFNKNGQIDHLKGALLYEMGNTRIKIGEVHFWQGLGLCEFKKFHTPYGQIGIRNQFKNEDKWFFRSLDGSYHYLYQCWQQVANILNIFFKIIPEKDKIYLTPVINGISKGYPTADNNKSFQWLKNFLNKKYSSTINYKRKKIAHSECSSSDYYWEFLTRISDPEKLARFQKERDESPDKLGKSYKDVLEGIENMLNLINETII